MKQYGFILPGVLFSVMAGWFLLFEGAQLLLNEMEEENLVLLSQKHETRELTSLFKDFETSTLSEAGVMKRSRSFSVSGFLVRRSLCGRIDGGSFATALLDRMPLIKVPHTSLSCTSPHTDELTVGGELTVPCLVRNALVGVTKHSFLAVHSLHTETLHVAGDLVISALGDIEIRTIHANVSSRITLLSNFGTITVTSAEGEIRYATYSGKSTRLPLGALPQTELLLPPRLHSLILGRC